MVVLERTQLDQRGGCGWIEDIRTTPAIALKSGLLIFYLSASTHF